jgi:hypothetical protein
VRIATRWSAVGASVVGVAGLLAAIASAAVFDGRAATEPLQAASDAALDPWALDYIPRLAALCSTHDPSVEPERCSFHFGIGVDADPDYQAMRAYQEASFFETRMRFELYELISMYTDGR